MNRYTQTEKKYEKWVKEGRGQGRLMDYKPWLNVQDVPSLGRSHRVLSATNGRVIHLLSDLEFNTFLVLDWNDDIIDIREQFPLNLDVTSAIASELDICHPRAYRTDMVMTTDLLVDQKNPAQPLLAIQVKPSSQLTDSRTKEKLLVEKRYWQSLNIPFQIVTEKHLNDIYLENLKWLYPARFGSFELNNMIKEATVYAELLQKFGNEKLTNALIEIDRHRGLKLGESLSKVRELLARKYFSFQLTKTFYTLNSADIKTTGFGKTRC